MPFVLDSEINLNMNITLTEYKNIQHFGIKVTVNKCRKKHILVINIIIILRTEDICKMKEQVFVF